jgi:hypothetical protein
MDRGEILFAQNWVEDWKRNVRERGLLYIRSTNEPSLEYARVFGVDLFSWQNSSDMWSFRMECLNPRWITSDVDELRRTAYDSVPQMIR